jgi:hypothetical protein
MVIIMRILVSKFGLKDNDLVKLIVGVVNHDVTINELRPVDIYIY